jgi:hypothetical protein
MAKRTAVPNEHPNHPLAPIAETGAPVLLTSRVIEIAWIEFSKLIPPETHPLQVKTYKRFFFAGAKALMDNLVYSDTLEEGSDDLTETDGKRIDAIMHEIMAFWASVANSEQ